MAITSATPYLILNGKAAEAIPHYERALGAKVVSVQRFGEVQNDCAEAMKNHVMHAVLQLDGATIFLSDGAPGATPAAGGTVNVALDIDREAQAREIFAALSKGGTVVQPLFEAPWGAFFGALQDRFGINWMFNAAKS